MCSGRSLRRERWGNSGPGVILEPSEKDLTALLMGPSGVWERAGTVTTDVIGWKEAESVALIGDGSSGSSIYGGGGASQILGVSDVGGSCLLGTREPWTGRWT